LLGCLVVLGIVGCGGPTGPTAGVVRFDDGTAVQSGSIEFRRLSDKERFSSRIAGDGSFTPADKKGKVGLPPGKYEVVIVQIVMTEDLAKDAHTHGGTVPRRYADYYTSGLEVEVAEGEADPIEVLIESIDAGHSDERGAEGSGAEGSGA
jgi:hypothetical protein